MCTEDVYTDVYPDGRRSEYVRPSFCERSRHGAVCDPPVVYKHPTRYLQAGEPSSQYAYPGVLPPSPRQTPRATTPNHYRSGDESDRSHHSSGSDKKRASGVYINGHKVMDLNGRTSTGNVAGKSRPKRNERIVIVDSPPTQRTPPQQFTMPYTAPPSPNASGNTLPYNIVEAGPTADARRRPVIVDERPRPHVSIEVVNERRRSKHDRHPSTDSRHSHTSSSAGPSDDEARRARRREDKIRAEEELKRQKLRARIAAANDEIKRRQPVPVPRAPPKRANTGVAPPAPGAYVRPAVEVAMPMDSHERELVESVRKLGLGERRRAERVAEAERRAAQRAAEQAAEQAEMEEEEAQRQRLKERMQPKRRATVGPGSRRHRVLYDDGLYRWE